MYKCNKCGELVDELPTYNESCYGGDDRYYDVEHYDAECSCGGEYLEADRCELCGDYICEDYDLFYADRTCNECVEKLKDMLLEARNKMIRETFTEEQWYIVEQTVLLDMEDFFDGFKY